MLHIIIEPAGGESAQLLVQKISFADEKCHVQRISLIDGEEGGQDV